MTRPQDTYPAPLFERLTQTANTRFFGDVTIVLNEVDTLNACYERTLALLKAAAISHTLPVALPWVADRLNPESFVYLNAFSLRLQHAGQFEISAHVLQHEPYHRDDYVIANYLSMRLVQPPHGEVSFLYAFFDGDLRARSAPTGACYRVDAPAAMRTAWARLIDPDLT